MRTITDTDTDTLTDTSPSRPDVLVSPDWLAAHIGDPDVRVIEVDVSRAAYDDWHVDGAALWNIYADLKDPEYRTVGPDAFQALLERTGVTPTSTVVFYGYAPTFGFWMTKLFGHADAHILDCSRDTWLAAGRPTTGTTTPGSTTGTTTASGTGGTGASGGAASGTSGGTGDTGSGSGSSSPALAFTGSPDLAPLIGTGLALLLVGALVRWQLHRRARRRAVGP